MTLRYLRLSIILCIYTHTSVYTFTHTDRYAYRHKHTIRRVVNMKNRKRERKQGKGRKEQGIKQLKQQEKYKYESWRYLNFVKDIFCYYFWHLMKWSCGLFLSVYFYGYYICWFSYVESSFCISGTKPMNHGRRTFLCVFRFGLHVILHICS